MAGIHKSNSYSGRIRLITQMRRPSAADFFAKIDFVRIFFILGKGTVNNPIQPVPLFQDLPLIYLDRFEKAG